MQYIPLSPEFKLPSADDYDDVIEGMQADVEDEGGAAHFLGTITEGRIMSEPMQNRVIIPLTKRAFLYEDSRFNGLPPNTNLQMSRRVLSGMMFGHIVNEATHPNVYGVDPYSERAQVNETLMTESQREYFREQFYAPRGNRVMAYRMGTTAMANLFLSQLSESSTSTIEGWADEMVGKDGRKPFKTGFGMALYLAWDAYSDIMISNGRGAEVMSLPSMRRPITSQESKGSQI